MMAKHEKLEVQIVSLTSNNKDKIKHISSLENDLMAIKKGSRHGIFFFCGTPTEKALREGQHFRKTEVAESPIPSHTDVVADYTKRTNCILFNVGIGTCLNVGA